MTPKSGHKMHVPIQSESEAETYSRRFISPVNQNERSMKGEITDQLLVSILLLFTTSVVTHKQYCDTGYKKEYSLGPIKHSSNTSQPDETSHDEGETHKDGYSVESIHVHNFH